MPLLINREVVEDSWTLIDEENLQQTGDIIVPLALYNEHKAQFEAHSGQVGIKINGDDNLDEVLENLDKFPLVAVDFPAFRDGRGFSIARHLVRAGYKGEIRATGDVGRDRFAYMERCGFTAIQISDEEFTPDMLNAFTEMSNYYQSAADNIRAVYKQ
ncbi:DUF934 domain-containing protein [Neptuniibacter caesariensis]|uniref:Oxidoreductase n=1 Tax=Neptuniibacter caesariensis TaxID=207954 RepID=A0A7U8GTK9_NEPCE|nr:DUF934 domain-containing protein [Neptuniibacter caesariensis]EAR62443.1 hypothetical protein MED92_15438 [Oceanospirillum sp. MED92] [Neptuniibacter caesariensis]